MAHIKVASDLKPSTEIGVYGTAGNAIKAPCGRRLNKYDNQDLEAAIEAVQTGMSQRLASKKFKVPQIVLKDIIREKFLKDTDNRLILTKFSSSFHGAMKIVNTYADRLGVKYARHYLSDSERVTSKYEFIHK